MKDNNEFNGCYDKETNSINFSNMRATDMKRNKRVYFPEPSDEELEIKCQNLKIKIMATYHEWKDFYGNTEKYNLKPNENDGLDKLLVEIDNKKLVVFESAK